MLFYSKFLPILLELFALEMGKVCKSLISATRIRPINNSISREILPEIKGIIQSNYLKVKSVTSSILQVVHM